MPNKDGTGPEGKGPKTGRQMGKCQDAKPMNQRMCQNPRGRGQGRRFQDWLSSFFFLINYNSKINI